MRGRSAVNDVARKGTEVAFQRIQSTLSGDPSLALSIIAVRPGS